MKRYFRAVARYGARAVAFGQQRAVRFGNLWRRSLQVRVVISTLALSSAVVFVLGMVLQNQITDRLLDTKEEAALAATRDSVAVAQRELIGVNPSVDAVRNRLTQALNKLTSSTPNTDTISSSAGTFEPVLAAESPDLGDGSMISVGPYADVPDSLRHFVENKRLAVQIHTVDRPTGRTTFLMVGAPFGTAQQLVHLYMLFPLTAEQSTIAVVQSTLLVGGLVLLLLLAGIANLVTRQVVRPVRGAAQAAERFADGDLDERMIVVGEDDVARLAESYNEMAGSIQRQIRQLEEFGSLQRRFTSDVSHELRTPLTTVRMAADVLHASREQFPPGLARSTELLVDELDRFESLLGDLLEISRLDAGVEELIAETVDVRPIAVRAAQAVATIARNAGTEIILDLPDGEVTADVDDRRIERIMRNLLANAVDHGDGHPVRLRMAINDHALAVTVRDYGVGLRTGEAGLVFNRFWRADPSRNRHTGGTGLGLAISLEDARLHGGGLDAWGEPGKGACFRLTLPRQQDIDYSDSPLALPPPDADIPNVVAADVEPFTEIDAVRVTVAGVGTDPTAADADSGPDADLAPDADDDPQHRTSAVITRPANITGSVTGSVTGANGTTGSGKSRAADATGPGSPPDGQDNEATDGADEPLSKATGDAIEADAGDDMDEEAANDSADGAVGGSGGGRSGEFVWDRADGVGGGDAGEGGGGSADGLVQEDVGRGVADDSAGGAVGGSGEFVWVRADGVDGGDEGSGRGVVDGAADGGARGGADGAGGESPPGAEGEVVHGTADASGLGAADGIADGASDGERVVRSGDGGGGRGGGGRGRGDGARAGAGGDLEPSSVVWEEVR